MLKRLVIITFCVLSIVSFVLLTDPQSLPIGLLLIPFILVAVFLYQLCMCILIVFRLGNNHFQKQRLAALLFSAIMTNFLILESIGKLSAVDIVLAAGISLVLGIYIAKFQLIPK